jgi:hypothetical protein
MRWSKANKGNTLVHLFPKVMDDFESCTPRVAAHQSYTAGETEEPARVFRAKGDDRLMYKIAYISLTSP